ncbi:MAG: hypothetical protein CO001_00790 [Candidatus Portnoybacteria bacterium CG_4_8_14_3_um_filter_40_10]|uniref:Uncharacterized protein n=4 Tax=Candidatus Portnoyibacteriota TaxID=1817913 RepID=A0A2M7IJA2_9BACT|nr:MAG: hypothetical protein COV84_03565 [Candidatus Portnoybacteria bacterium CG11_big_fil_rev_8_21_14_0_20_40_15]PIS29856.1 MAG: hypothetical protein COT41_04050 [Candidatus Portnoybacteria bacterium CG08_land_8_20_14_0_20_40_83]PIW76539.1 MAG: hypothetical protein CO001_00790 [Candidatus Portnoybacteria bacterium CG_4_8_14_3_um_filter_40_10]PIY74193.1 MAG: hypothetical protein COY85_03985 [Candidatus Portnoybacteria bacterium CG_4_10_14_0_8_um_filter_40_50]PJA64180.1 MAG: hypothetical protei
MGHRPIGKSLKISQNRLERERTIYSYFMPGSENSADPQKGGSKKIHNLALCGKQGFKSNNPTQYSKPNFYYLG